MVLCCQWWGTINLFSNRWTNYSYSKSKVALPGISKLDDSVTDKNHGDQAIFYAKKDSRKRKMDLILPIFFATTPADGHFCRVIGSSSLQKFFLSVSKCS